MPFTNQGLNTKIFRITHYHNLEFTLRNGLFSPNSPAVDPNYMNIGHRQLIQDRGHSIIRVEPGGVINDYVSFYFAPRSPMLYSICHGRVSGVEGTQSEIAYVISTIGRIQQAERPFVFTNGHAYIAYSEHFNNIADLNRIDWDIMNTQYWRNTTDDMDRRRRRMAEFLVYQFVPVSCILGIATYNQEKLDYVNNLIRNLNLNIDTRIERDWYYYS